MPRQVNHIKKQKYKTPDAYERVVSTVYSAQTIWRWGGVRVAAEYFQPDLKLPAGRAVNNREGLQFAPPGQTRPLSGVTTVVFSI